MKNTLFTFFTAILFVLSLAAVQRNAIWNDELILWSDVIKKSPMNIRGHLTIGIQYIAKGLLEKALEKLNTVLNINKQSPKPVSHFISYFYTNLGVFYASQGLMESGLRNLLTAITLYPQNYKAHNNLGLLYWGQGQQEKAINEFLISITIYPEYAAAHNNLGVAFERLGLYEKALLKFQTTLRIDPDHAQAKSNLEKLLNEIKR